MELFCKCQLLLGTDQPGRLLAVFVIAPVLMYKGYKYGDVFIMLFALLLFLWDAHWLFSGK